MLNHEFLSNEVAIEAASIAELADQELRKATFRDHLYAFPGKPNGMSNQDYALGVIKGLREESDLETNSGYVFLRKVFRLQQMKDILQELDEPDQKYLDNAACSIYYLFGEYHYSVWTTFLDLHLARLQTDSVQ